MEFKPGFHFIQYFLNVKKLVEINFAFRLYPLDFLVLFSWKILGDKPSLLSSFVSDQIRRAEGCY